MTYLNVDMQLHEGHRRGSTIQGGEPVWFGCDVGKMMSNDYGIWDADLYDLPSVYDTAFDLDKAARLDYHETADDARDAVHRRRRASTGRPGAGGWRTAGARTAARRASTR